MDNNEYDLENVLEGYALEEQPTTRVQPAFNMDDILSKAREQQAINEEYIKGLQKLYNRAGAYNLRDVGANMLTRGLDRYYNIDVFNKPLQNRGWTEANKYKTDLLGKLQQAKLANYDLGADTIGNAYIAQAIGLPPEAALGSKEIFKAISPVLSSMNALQGRRYAADISLERTRLVNDAKIKMTNLNNARAMAIAQGTWNTQKEIAYNRDKVNLQRSLISALGFNQNPAQLLNAANAIGAVSVDPNQLNTLLGIEEEDNSGKW